MSMTAAEKSRSIGGLIAVIPYALVAWGYTKLDPETSFWAALGVMIGVRLFFAIIETLGGVLAWRLHGRAIAVNNALRLFRENEFPARLYRHDGLSSYLARIVDDDSTSPELRRTAQETERMLGLFEDVGILPGWRLRSATEAALDIYSPREKAPEWSPAT